MLKYNERGGAVVRQSDLSAWSRCGLQKHYYDIARDNPDDLGVQPERLSATVYGTVVHYAAMVLEKMHHDGDPDALGTAIATFEHYWNPGHIAEVADGQVTEWLPRQTYGGLMDRGRMALRDYYEVMLKKDDSRLLALEYQFAVPLVGTDGRVHTLTGTIDRLSIRKHYGKPYLSQDDYKTGKQPTYLRYNMQGTAYSYATTTRDFWVGPTIGLWDGPELDVFGVPYLDDLARFFHSWGYSLLDGGEKPLAARRFRWINLQEMKYADGGWRTAQDYERLRVAVSNYVAAVEAEAYPVTTTGEVCRYCPFKSICGGVGLPPESAGAP